MIDMRAAILALALASPAFGAIEVAPVDTGTLSIINGIQQQFPGDPEMATRPPNFLERGVVEFDLSGESPSSEPIYFRFYLNRIGGTAGLESHVHAFNGDGMVSFADYNQTNNFVTSFADPYQVPAGTVLLPMDLISFNIDVTQEFNDHIGRFLGLLLTTDEPGRYSLPTGGIFEVGGDFVFHAFPGALTLGTELLGPVRFPAPEPSSFFIWLPTAVAIGWSCSRLRYSRRAA